MIGPISTLPFFVQNPVGSTINHKYNETTLELLGTQPIFGTYPYTYGFIPNTLAPDGDCVDAFLISKKPCPTGATFDAEIIGLMETWEDEMVDHKVLFKLPDEELLFTESDKKELVHFEENIFSDRPGKTMKVGQFFGPQIGWDFYKNHPLLTSD